MNKAEYLDLLRKDLGVIPYNEVQEIVAEINEHFEMAASKGKSEDTIAEELGDVHELAKSYINITPNKLPTALRENNAKKPVHKGARVFVILFNVFVGAPLGIAWVAADLALVYRLLIVEIPLFIARFALIGNVGAYLTAAIMFQIATFFGLIANICLIYFGISLFIRCFNKYLRWNRKIWNKGF